jgi:hypothetical protein
MNHLNIAQDKQPITTIKTKTSAYIEHRLEEWAEWYLAIEEDTLGYKKCTTEYRLMKFGNAVRSQSPGSKALPINPAADEIEDLICAMAKEKRHQKNAYALRVYYLIPGDEIHKKAAIAGMSRSQFLMRVDLAKEWLIGWFSGYRSAEANARKKMKATTNHTLK